MPERKARLGRGLAELLGEGRVEGRSRAVDGPVAREAAAAGETAEQPPRSAAELPVSLLRPNPRQPRRDMDRSGLEELAESMRSLGIVQPIIVRPADAGFEIIAGERRWRAAQLAGFTVVPVIVREASDAESLEIALVENVVRRQLNPVDEAYALQVLLEDLGVTQEALAAQLGRSRPALTNKMRLLDLPGPVQELVARGELSEGHGRALLGLRQRGDQIRLAQRAAARGLSVRSVEAEVKKMAASGASPSSQPTQSLSPELLVEAREHFRETFGVLPRIKMGTAGGKVELPFRDEAQLADLLRRLPQ